MSDFNVDSSFQLMKLMKIDKYAKSTEWTDYSTGQSTVIQKLKEKTLN